jgi:hypothetical protein
MTDRELKRLKKKHTDMSLRQELPSAAEELLAARSEVDKLRREVRCFEARLSGVMARVVTLEFRLSAIMRLEDGGRE